MYCLKIIKAASFASVPDVEKKTLSRPAGCSKLKGADDIYRVRIGDYRLLYQVRDDVLLVLVVSVRKREDVYKKLR